VSVLTGPEIQRVVERTKARNVDLGYKSIQLPAIDVDPWRPECAGPNSLDVHLGSTLLRYDLPHGRAINPSSPPKTTPLATVLHGGLEGWLLYPGVLYLGATEERAELHGVCAQLTGRSSLGRLGVDCHVSAGLIDDGFAGNITLEIRVIHPIILWPGMRFAQLVFEHVVGDRRPYRGRYYGDSGPVASRFGEGR
jgi:deoxycytidine triphosphate deaminase